MTRFDHTLAGARMIFLPRARVIDDGQARFNAVISTVEWFPPAMNESKEAVDAEANRLLREFGEKAYEHVRASIQIALKQRNLQMSAFLAAVAAEVALRMERQFGIQVGMRHPAEHRGRQAN